MLSNKYWGLLVEDFVLEDKLLIILLFGLVLILLLWIILKVDGLKVEILFVW